MTDLRGRDIGGFTVVSLLGRGGMGEVYRAHDPRLGRDVAIKILPPEIAGSAERVARFEREARLLAALSHSHIGAIYGVVEDAGVRGLVLELIEGQTLRDRIASGLSADEALRFAEQLADALDFAHERGIVHRDLKPENIKITPEGEVKVLDFGIAKVRSESEGGIAHGTTLALDTSDGVVLGTTAFMSPEQARGTTVDKRADIWAFGCVLYQMLTGRQAFAGATHSDTIAAVLERDPDWSALPATTPPAIRRLLRRCLEKDVRRRVRDIGDARTEIAEARAGVLDSTAAGAAETPPSRSALAPALLAAIGLAALAATAWVAGIDRGGRSPAVSPSPRVSRTVRLTNTPAREFGPAISPDGKWVAYYSDARGPTDIWVTYLDSGATLNLTASLAMRLPVRTNIGGLAISPDGGSLAFGTRDATENTYDTWVMPAPLGGPPRKLLEGMQGAQWSPDGKHLAYIWPGSSLGDTLIVADADGSNPREILPAAGGRHVHWPRWSRDGQSLYFIYSYQPWNTEQSEIYRVPAAGGAPEAVVKSIRRAVYPVPLPGGDLLFSANPESVDLGLWWQSGRGGTATPLTTGVGEYIEATVSNDGRRLVSMVIDQRQSLVAIDVTGPRPTLHPLTDGHGGDLDPSQDPTSDRIVFSSTRSGHRNLWTARQDATDARPLTSGTASDHHPVFSPDGRRIAFVSDRGGRWGIWLVTADGGAPRLLAPATVFDSITWSGDGTRILFSTPSPGGATVLSTVSVADGRVEAFSTPSAATAPSWSYAADAIAYLETAMEKPPGATAPVARIRVRLRFVDSQGRVLFPNLPEQTVFNGMVAWAPDGKRLAVVTVSGNAPATLWIVEPAAATPFRRVLEFQPTVRPRGLTWTRDGSRLIISSQESLSDLVLYDLER